jgi:hypothetical protein
VYKKRHTRIEERIRQLQPFTDKSESEETAVSAAASEPHLCAYTEFLHSGFYLILLRMFRYIPFVCRHLYNLIFG